MPTQSQVPGMGEAARHVRGRDRGRHGVTGAVTAVAGDNRPRQGQCRNASTITEHGRRRRSRQHRLLDAERRLCCAHACLCARARLLLCGVRVAVVRIAKLFDLSKHMLQPAARRWRCSGLRCCGADVAAR